MATFILFENNDESFLANAETITAVKVGIAWDALILGPIWAFRGSVILWFPLLFGILLMLSPLYFYSSIEDIKFSENLENVCIETVESGSMTKDLAILIDKSAKYLTTNEFLEAINSNLKKKLN